MAADTPASDSIEIRTTDLADLEAMYAALRGRAGIKVQLSSAPMEPGEQGSAMDVLTIAVSGGAVTALLEIIRSLIELRGSGFHLEIRTRFGRFDLDTDDPEAAVALLMELIERINSGS